MDAEQKRGPGRPKGSRNKPSSPPEHADPDTLISRQFVMLEMAQAALRRDMERMVTGDEKWVQSSHVVALEKLSNALVRAVEALKKSADLADEMASRMTAEQLLEAAIKKLEAQDVRVIRYAVKRLRARLEVVEQPAVVAPTDTAADALAALVES